MSKIKSTHPGYTRRVLSPSHRPRVHNREKISTNHNMHPLPPPPPVQPSSGYFVGPFKLPENRDPSALSKPRIKPEPTDSMHEPVVIRPGSRGSAQNPILIELPPSLDEIKEKTLPQTTRSHYVRHSDLTEEQAKERRRQQNRQSAKRTRNKNRKHIQVLERRYEDLREKYQSLREIVLQKRLDVQLPRFSSNILASSSNQISPMPVSDERFEKSPQIKSEVPDAWEQTLRQKDDEIKRLKDQVRALQRQNEKLSESMKSYAGVIHGIHQQQQAAGLKQEMNYQAAVPTPPPGITTMNYPAQQFQPVRQSPSPSSQGDEDVEMKSRQIPQLQPDPSPQQMFQPYSEFAPTQLGPPGVTSFDPTLAAGGMDWTNSYGAGMSGMQGMPGFGMGGHMGPMGNMNGLDPMYFNSSFFSQQQQSNADARDTAMGFTNLGQ